MASEYFAALQRQLPPARQLNKSDLIGIFSNSSVGFSPTDATCFPFVARTYNLSGANLCPTTPEMINFLNLTDFNAYFISYCQNLPGDDGCPFGWCPNSDIAVIENVSQTPLLRRAAYFITFFVTIIVYYEPEALKESFWSQLFTVYSFLITAVISISKGELTRIHAVIATGMAASPLTIYLFVYAIRSLWGGGDRMRILLGKGEIIPRTLVLIALAIWLVLVVYILRPSSSRFNQASCEHEYSKLVFKGFFFLPLLVFTQIYHNPSTHDIADKLIFLAALPFGLVIISWIIAILLRRKDIWPKGEPFRFKSATVW
ncbi:hypothetical protein M422DRAFT_44327 [Sphaerobolus stellatus SS14]|nr:hypothetical protein M422DRAFT_44327 [Sphaerobolus stellatus SS14]